jgi:acetyl esterase
MKLLWIHGGGWHSYDETDTTFFTSLGFDVVHARYRLSGEAQWPAQLSDVMEAAADLSTSPFIVAGDSAGAHLALHVGLRMPAVAGVLAFEAPVDPLAPNWTRANTDNPNNPWQKLLGHVPIAGDPATVDATVTSHVGNGVPVFVWHANADTAVPPSQALLLAEALLSAGHPVHLSLVDGTHGALDFSRADIQAAVRRFLLSTNAFSMASPT